MTVVIAATQTTVDKAQVTRPCNAPVSLRATLNACRRRGSYEDGNDRRRQAPHSRANREIARGGFIRDLGVFRNQAESDSCTEKVSVTCTANVTTVPARMAPHMDLQKWLDGRRPDLVDPDVLCF